ncbi:DUF3857 domain-containing protein [Chitinophaga horti]|uniref:DUF3857 domain-containing protein n=1 Tax=Chitinophaga horti TaxID=2920382 RepID=A0ABY6J409_9BACT|nr:DUF3857 domain-containing protein [Chitinophaga horti]UYQ92919.1 DUF3857 domain-containing protein [Chitinophaga horti]
MLPVILRGQNMRVSISSTPSWLVPYQPDPKRQPALREVDNGYYEVLFEEQHHVERKTVYNHVVRRIVSEAGVQNGAEISVEYRPAYEQLHFHTLQLRRNGQLINLLNPSKFKFLQQEKDLAQFIYNGTATALFFPEDLRKGDELEYSYSVIGRNPIFEDKYFDSFYFYSDEPIMNYYCALIASPTRELEFSASDGADDPVEKRWGGLALYEWDLKDKLKVTDSDDEAPYVQVTEYTSWAQIINWAFAINKTSGTGIQLAEKIRELKSKANGDTTRYLLSAIRFVQDDIRYLGIEMGENSHRPVEPDRVLIQRYGDCKDKSLLLVNLIDGMGVKAYMAYVNTFRGSEVIDFLPSPFAFNHAIVMIDYHGKNYWIDPTIAYQRGVLDKRGSLPYGRAMVIKPGAKGFMKVDGGNDGNIEAKEKFLLSTKNDGSTQLQVRTKYSGGFADEVRAEFAEYSLKSRENSFRDYYNDTYWGVYVKDSLYTKDDEENNEFEVIESYKIIQAWMYDTLLNNGSITFTSHVKTLADQVPGVGLTLGTGDVVLKYPYKVDYEVELHMPVNWSNVPAPVHLKNQYYRYDFTATTEGNVIRLRYQYETFGSDIPALYKEQYRAEAAKMAASLNLLFTFNPRGSFFDGGPAGGWNWLMVVLGGLFTIAFTVLAVLYASQHVHPLKLKAAPLQINGPLVLLGLWLVFSAFYLLMALVTTDSFFYCVWQEMVTLAPGNASTLLQLGLVCLVLCQVMVTVYAVMLCVLYFRRRDTFPPALVAFHVLLLILLVAIRFLPDELRRHQTLSSGFVPDLAMLLSAAIWVPYILLSARAKGTFVMPHSSDIAVVEDEGPVVADYSPMKEGIVPVKPYVEGRVRETRRRVEVDAELMDAMLPLGRQVAEVGFKEDADAVNAMLVANQPAQEKSLQADAKPGHVMPYAKQHVKETNIEVGAMPSAKELSDQYQLQKTVRQADAESINAKQPAAKSPATHSASDDVQSAPEPAQRGVSPSPGSAAADVLATLRTIQSAPKPAAREVQPTSLSPEPEPESAADNILKTIRFLHSQKQQDGGPLDSPNILLINEKPKED